MLHLQLYHIYITIRYKTRAKFVVAKP